MAEQRGRGRSLYVLHHLWEQLKDYSERSGQSVSSIVEWCVSYALKAWEKTHLEEVKQKVAEVVKGKSKGEALAEAYGKNILFGDVDLKEGTVKGEGDLYEAFSELDPFVRKKRKRIEWQPV